jgi:transcriptional regulator with XRE-family HTH domain
MAYRVEVSPRSRHVGRFIGRVRNELLKAISDERRASGLNQQRLAEKLELQRAELNRQLAGRSHLTLRSVAELSWALGCDIHFELRKPTEEPGQNLNLETTTLEWNPPTLVGDKASNQNKSRAAKANPFDAAPHRGASCE